MAKKKQKAKARDPRVILAEKKAETDRLESKIAEQEAANDPVFDAIRERIEDLQKQTIVHAKGFGSGAQSYKNRILVKQLWVSQIEAERDLAEHSRDSIKHEIKLLRSQMSALVAQGDVSNEAVDTAITQANKTAIEAFPDVAKLERMLENATENRKAYTQLIKTPARKRPQSAEEAN